eukprot:GHVU01074923.1.p6 GENE.GHVU01074923.1~~GHVU01074923.1.p6  ORF type:complete len:116 (+),score=19.93 GHVU01074923.1:496-843(+)
MPELRVGDPVPQNHHPPRQPVPAHPRTPLSSLLLLLAGMHACTHGRTHDRTQAGMQAGKPDNKQTMDGRRDTYEGTSTPNAERENATEGNTVRYGYGGEMGGDERREGEDDIGQR